ncbi:MAG: hypothetical protein ABJM06_01675 [Gilvibacter sp.]
MKLSCKHFILFLTAIGIFPFSGYSQHFYSGFEGDSKVIRTSKKADDIVGGEVISGVLNDWERSLEDAKGFGSFDLFQIYYQAGNKRQRRATIVDDPLAPRGTNKVLKFEIRKAYPSDKRDKNSPRLGRIAAQLINVDITKGIKETGFSKLHYGFKMMLPENYQLIKNDTAYQNSWYTIAELWNNGGWSNLPYPYRIKLDIVKYRNSNTLRFVVKGQFKENGKWQADWEKTNNWYDIPLGEWLDMDIYFKEGDARRGRFILKVNKRTIIRAKNRTHHPDAKGRAIDGMTHVDLLKLYTGGDKIDHMLELGVRPTIYWDDFIIYDDAKTEIRTSFWQSNRD